MSAFEQLSIRLQDTLNEKKTVNNQLKQQIEQNYLNLYLRQTTN